MVEINTTDELFALLYECAAVLDDIFEGDDEDILTLQGKLSAVLSARASMSRALKLRPTGDGYRDRIVAAKLDVRSDALT